MTTFTEKLNDNFNNSALYNFLGQEKAEEFKQSVMDLILERMREDLNDSQYYLLCPDDVGDIIQGMRDEIKTEIMNEMGAEIKEKIKAQILASL